jgi:WD40 repeat protein
LGTVRFRHSGQVQFVGFAHGGRILISASRYDGLRASDAVTGRELWCRPLGQSGDRVSLALSGDGTTVALTHPEGILVLDAPTGKERRRFLAASKEARNVKGLQGPHLRLSHEGKRLVTYGESAEQAWITLWDVPTGNRLHRLKVLGSVGHAALTPDGKLLAASIQDAEGRSRLQFWDVASGKEVRSVVIPDGWAGEFHFLPDGKRLLVIRPSVQSAALFDTATGTRLQRFEPTEGPFTGFALSRDGKRLCAAGPDGLTVWEIRTGIQAARLPLPRSGEKSRLVTFAPDGKRLAVAEGQAVGTVDLGTGRATPARRGHSTPVHRLAFSPSGAQLLSVSDEEALLWDVRTGKERHRLAPERPRPEDKGGRPNVPELFEDLDLLGLDVSCAFAPDGRRVAVLWGDGPIQIWDAARGKALQLIRCPTAQQRLAYSPSGLLGSAGQDGLVRLWDPGTGKQVKQFGWKRPARKGQRDEAEDGLIAGLAFTPDGKAVAVAAPLDLEGPQTSVFALWEVSTGARRLEVTTREAGPAADREDLLAEVNEFGALGVSLEMSRDGSCLLIGSLSALRLWDAETGKELRQFGGAGVNCWTAALSPDGKLLAAGRMDGKLRVWDVATGTVLRDFPAHPGAVTAVAFSPDGGTVATGSADTTVLVWDLAEVLRDRRPTPRPPGAAELRNLWEDLASKDGVRAFRAVRALSKVGAPGVEFLKDRLLTGKAPAQQVGLVRGLRALEVLERLKTPEARAVLQAVARGASEDRLRDEARASLQRLARHSPSPGMPGPKGAPRTGKATPGGDG